MILSTIDKNYSAYLENLKNEKEAQKIMLQAQNRFDEVKHTAIELNIISIFTQMFHNSINRLQADATADALKRAYLPFFDSIPQNWHIRLERCIHFGEDEEAYIETLKIKQAAAIKAHFLNLIE